MLITGGEQGKTESVPKDSMKESELFKLVEDFYKHYQSLNALYDLKRATRKMVSTGKDKDGAIFSPSGSDSEYYSSDESDSNNSLIEVVDKEKYVGLQARLESSLKEREDEISACKIEFSSLSGELEKSKGETIRAMAKIEGLTKEVDFLQQKLKSFNSQKAQSETRSSKEILELEKTSGHKGDELVSLRRISGEINGTRNEGLHDKISELDKELTRKEDEHVSLEKICDVLRTRDSESEEALGKKEDEVFSLEKNCELKETENRGIQTRNSELEEVLSQREDGLVCLEEMGKFKDQEIVWLVNRISELEKALREKEEDIVCIEKRCVLKENGNKGLGSKKGEELISFEKKCECKEIENEGINTKISELNGKPTRKGDKLVCLKTCEDREIQASIDVIVLKEQIGTFKEELEFLRDAKTLIELQEEKYKEELSQVCLKVENQQIALKEQEESIKKLNSKNEPGKSFSPVYRITLQNAERKMEELARKFQTNLEDNIQILYRTIRVAEELHTKNRENYRKRNQTYEKEYKNLKKMILTLEAEMKKMEETSVKTEKALTGMETMVKMFEENSGNLLSSVSRNLTEIQLDKCVVSERHKEVKKLRDELSYFSTPPDDMAEKEYLLKENVCDLEADSSKGGERMSHIEAINELEKKVRDLEKKVEEKDERWRLLAEEKREAIRQLCVLIDYHQSECNHLWEVILNKTVQSRIGS